MPRIEDLISGRATIDREQVKQWHQRWQEFEKQQERVFEKRREGLKQKLWDLQERQETIPAERYRPAEDQILRAMDLVDFGEEFANANQSEPHLSDPDLGDLPQQSTDHLNGRARRIAFELSDGDDGKAFRALLASIGFQIEVLRTWFIYETRLLRADVRKNLPLGSGIIWLQAAILAAILWRVW